MNSHEREDILLHDCAIWSNDLFLYILERFGFAKTKFFDQSNFDAKLLRRYLMVSSVFILYRLSRPLARPPPSPPISSQGPSQAARGTHVT
jgi:hypothetical protein